MMRYSKINKNDYTEFHQSEYSKKFNIWLIDPIEEAEDDVFLYSFDKEIILNFWEDFPKNFTPEQIEIFRKYAPELTRLKGY